VKKFGQGWGKTKKKKKEQTTHKTKKTNGAELKKRNIGNTGRDKQQQQKLKISGPDSRKTKSKRKSTHKQPQEPKKKKERERGVGPTSLRGGIKRGKPNTISLRHRKRNRGPCGGNGKEISNWKGARGGHR